MARKKDAETWCKTSSCVLAVKHEGACKVAVTPNERSARSNAAGPHEYEATLTRIRESNEQETARAGLLSVLASKPEEGLKTTFADVARASGEAEAKKAKPVQTAMFAAEPPPVEYVEMEIWIPLSDVECRMFDRDSSDATSKADELQEQLKEISKPLNDKIKKLRKEASEKAKQSKERKRPLVQRVKVVFHPSRATKDFLNPETGEPVKVSEVMTPREIERYSLGGSEDEPEASAPPEGPAAETVDLEEADPLDEGADGRDAFDPDELH